MKKILTLSVLGMLAMTASAQWTDNFDTPQELIPNTENSYGHAVCTNAAGQVYYLYMHPNLSQASDEEDIQNVVYEWRLQGFDVQGNKLFGELGKLISDYDNLSYSVFNDYMMVDRDGNAVFAVPDQRYGTGMSLTAYKVSPTGEMLWGEEGIALDGKETAKLKTSTHVVQLENGSYVFTWVNSGNEIDDANACLQRVSADGKLLWNDADTRLIDDKSPYNYSWLVNAGKNQVIQVYTKGSGQELYARKIDVTGESLWSKDTRIYRAGWGSIPIWTIIEVHPSGDGGVIVSWNDDRDASNYDKAYLSYVTSNGKLGFSGQSDNGDVRLGYVDGHRALNVTCMADPSGDGFIAAWREVDRDQRFQQIRVQKVDLKGNLVWAEDGVAINEFEAASYGYISISSGLSCEATVFYMDHKQNFGDTDIKTYTFNTISGEAINSLQPATLNTIAHERGALEVCNAQTARCWYLNWTDDGPSQGDNPDDSLKGFNYIQRLMYDGTTGVQAVDAQTLRAVYAGGRFLLPAGADIEIFNMQGQRVASLDNCPQTLGWTPAVNGVYLAKVTVDGNSQTLKIVK